MYRYTLIFLALVACAPRTSHETIVVPAEPHVRKYLVAGQSNAVSLLRRDYPAPKSDLVLLNGSYPVNGAHDSVIWVLMANLMNEKMEIDNVAEGGTSIAMWVDGPDNRGNAAPLDTRIFNALKTKKYDALLWTQGETDYFNHTKSKTYYNKLKQLILMTQAVQPNLVWYVALTTDGPPNNPIRRAQEKIIAEGLAREGADLDQLRKTPAYVDPDDRHIDGAGYDALARMWFNILF